MQMTFSLSANCFVVAGLTMQMREWLNEEWPAAELLEVHDRWVGEKEMMVSFLECTTAELLEVLGSWVGEKKMKVQENLHHVTYINHVV
jgi:hypothetical protein